MYLIVCDHVNVSYRRVLSNMTEKIFANETLLFYQQNDVIERFKETNLSQPNSIVVLLHICTSRSISFVYRQH